MSKSKHLHPEDDDYEEIKEARKNEKQRRQERHKREVAPDVDLLKPGYDIREERY